MSDARRAEIQELAGWWESQGGRVTMRQMPGTLEWVFSASWLSDAVDVGGMCLRRPEEFWRFDVGHVRGGVTAFRAFLADVLGLRVDGIDAARREVEARREELRLAEDRLSKLMRKFRVRNVLPLMGEE